MEEKRIAVKQANRIVRITENELNKYISKGYTLVEDKAEAVQKSVPQKPIELVEPAKDVIPKKQRRNRK